MPEDINGLDVTDAGLKAIMGNRFHDETQNEPQKVISKKEATTTTHAEKTPQKAKDKPVTEQWEPSKQRNWMDNLRECGKLVAVFGGLSILLWYWQVSGLMDASVAVPSMCACTALAGWNLGKCARG